MMEAIMKVSTYCHPAQDMIPNTLVLKHRVATTIEITTAEVQGIFEIDSLESSPTLQEIDRRRGSPPVS